MDKQNNKLNFTLKVFVDSKAVERLETHSKRRLHNKIRTIKWQSGHSRVYLRVNYGKHLSSKNKIESFWNDGDYYNQKDLCQALEAFTE